MHKSVMKLILCCLLLNICSSATAHSSVEPRPPKQTFVYKRVDNIATKPDVYRLAGDDRRPVIVWIHPGGLIMGSREMLPADERERFRDTGFVVVAIEYRLAPETKLPEILKDVKDAHRWIREECPRLFQIDPNRMATAGASAGGYLALMAGHACILCCKRWSRSAGMEISRVRYSRPDPFYLTANHEDRRLNCRRKAALNILRYIDIELRTAVLTS